MNQYEQSIQNILESAQISLEIGDKPGAADARNLANIIRLGSVR